MYTNIFEQSKEIAILRAMGMTRSQIVRIYIYEAFVLVMAASVLGVMIGTIMGMHRSDGRMSGCMLPLYSWLFVGGLGVLPYLRRLSGGTHLLCYVPSLNSSLDHDASTRAVYPAARTDSISLHGRLHTLLAVCIRVLLLLVRIVHCARVRICFVFDAASP